MLTVQRVWPQKTPRLCPLPPGKFTAYMHDMCGRVIQASPPDQLGLKIIDALDPRDNRVNGDPFGNVPPRYNGAPSQQLWVIRRTPKPVSARSTCCNGGSSRTGARTS